MFLNKRDRLVLIKAMMSSIPNCYMSVWRCGYSGLKRVICYEYEIPMDTLRWDWNCGPNGSIFTKTIGRLCVQDTHIGKIIDCGINFIVGREDRAKFWTDDLLEGTPLKIAFPRIFALACNKNGNVRDFGRREGVDWRWVIPLRR
ncbi:hypothetical protein Dsin_021460 [Dipteronia sinensis]|uniref:Uncharacterized protein n=1 Tax=Dipteronia sinensis TaxID=43782 RepID=A0AAD9ZZQ2_9ROSI|nr:hypothetical protein Dsin_021460 [Dipteronia sinensis]